METQEAEKRFCKNCIFAEPLSETLDGVLYFCEFRGCACSPDYACHAFKIKNEEEITMENEKMNNTEVEAEANTNEEAKEETPVNEIKSGHMELSTIGVWGFYGAALGVRRSFRSTEKCDSKIDVKSYVPKESGPRAYCTEEELGEEDLKLMKKLVLRGADEAKFMRCIHVQVNIKAPLLWWKQFDTYKIGTVRLSDSTMHNILKDPIDYENFAASNVIDHPMNIGLAGRATSRTAFALLVQTLEQLRITWWSLKNTIIDKEYLETYGQEQFDKAIEQRKKAMDICWRQIIEMLPDSYLMESTIDLNYQTIRAICSAREGHKLNEWKIWNDWAKTLPYAEDLIFGRYKYLVESSEPIKEHDPEYISNVIRPLNISEAHKSEWKNEDLHKENAEKFETREANAVDFKDSDQIRDIITDSGE